MAQPLFPVPGEVINCPPAEFRPEFYREFDYIGPPATGGSPRFTSKREACYMQFLPGASALSVFKQAKLLASLQTICPELLAISARYIHYSMWQNLFCLRSAYAEPTAGVRRALRTALRRGGSQ